MSESYEQHSTEDLAFELPPADETDGLVLDGLARSVPSERALTPSVRIPKILRYMPEKALTYAKYSGETGELMSALQREILTATQDEDCAYDVNRVATAVRNTSVAEAMPFVELWRQQPGFTPLPQPVQSVLSHTLHAAITNPERIARARFMQARSEVLEDFPDNQSDFLAKLTKTVPDVRAAVSQLEEQVRELPYETSAIDFTSLSVEQQMEVAAYIDREARQLFRIGQVYGLYTGVQGKHRNVILLRPVSELEEVLENTAATPAVAINTFFDGGTAFDELLQAARERPVDQFARFTSGEVVELGTGESLNEAQDIRDMADKVIGITAKALHDQQGCDEPYPTLGSWREAKRPLHLQLTYELPRARRQRFTVVELPVDQTALRQYFPEYDPDQIPSESIRLLQFTLDLKPTGKPVTPASAGILVYLRNTEDGKVVEKRMVNRAKGFAAVQKLLDESKKTVERTTKYAMTTRGSAFSPRK